MLIISQGQPGTESNFFLKQRSQMIRVVLLTSLFPENLMTVLPINRYALPLVIAGLFLLLLLLLRSIFIRYWARWVEKNPHPFTQAALGLVRIPSIYWCIAIATYLSIDFANLSNHQSKQISQILYIAVVLSITSAISNIAVAGFKHYVGNPSGLLMGLIKGSILIMGGLVALSVLGISIAPLLTALGVGGLAVALALKDTLENLFSGIYLISEGALKKDDYIRLESGQEGVILDIGWRTTKIKLSTNNSVLIPNSKLAQSIVTNYSLPQKSFVSTLTVHAALENDIQKIESLLLEASKKASLELAGFLPDPEPNVRFNGNTRDGLLEFNLNFWVKDFTELSAVTHELRKKIHQIFTSAEISLAKKEVVILEKNL